MSDRRDGARRELNEHLSKGRDPHEACCMVIYRLLHVDADVIVGEYVGSFIDWVFEDDAAERERWHKLVGDQAKDSFQKNDFRELGF